MTRADWVWVYTSGNRVRKQGERTHENGGVVVVETIDLAGVELDHPGVLVALPLVVALHQVDVEEVEVIEEVFVVCERNGDAGIGGADFGS